MISRLPLTAAAADVPIPKLESLRGCLPLRTDVRRWTAKARTSTIPLVFFTLGDPVMSEFVHTFNRPAGDLQDPHHRQPVRMIWS
jgi:hypothetical protein